MARPEYPLQALRELRAERVQAQLRRLAEQVASTAQAEAKLLQRERSRRNHAEQTATSLRAERERLAASHMAAAELARAAEFEAGARAQATLLERAEQEARTELATQREQERLARSELSRLEADAELLKKHELGFHERARDVALRAEEEAALEQWNARQR